MFTLCISPPACKQGHTLLLKSWALAELQMMCAAAGRSRWDAWTAVKGTDAEKCKLRFVRLYYEFPPTALYKDTRGSA